MNSKPWYFSKTIWVNMVVGVLSALSAAFPHFNFLTGLISSNMVLISTVWMGLGVVLRLVTKDQIQLGD